MKTVLLKTLLFSLFCSSILFFSQAQQRQMREPGMEQTILHKDYKPQSIFKVPQTQILKAKYPAIDMHMRAPRRGDLQSAATALLKNRPQCE